MKGSSPPWVAPEGHPRRGRDRQALRRRRRRSRARPARAAIRNSNPSCDRVGMALTKAAWKVVGFAAPATPGSSVCAVDSLVPLPSESKARVALFETVWPPAAGRMVAVMVIVTEPPAGIAPFQVTVLVAVVATAVPLVAVAETSASSGGRTSMSSLPGLSAWAPGPLLLRTIV